MRVYRSRVDTWLAVVLAGSFLLMLSIFILPLINGAPIWPDLTITGGLFAVYSAFIGWLYLATKYKVSDTKVIIDGGLFKVTIPFSSIESIIKTKSVVASPAFSLDRLEITYEKTKTILISPKRQDEFLADIGWTRPI